MPLESWLPIGLKLPDAARTRLALFAGEDWQIYETMEGGRALVVHDALAQRWLNAGLIGAGDLDDFRFGEILLREISCTSSHALCPVSEGQAPDSKAEALSFALALKSTRAIDAQTPLQDALYVEKITRLLPTYGISSRAGDDVVMGHWLTGGANISVNQFRRLRQSMNGFGTVHLKEVILAAGFDVAEVVSNPPARASTSVDSTATQSEGGAEPGLTPTPSQRVFELPGRTELAAFFNEHVVDIVLNRERYQSLGIEFPAAVVLHGPPGCGKTFAVDQLVNFLGWPSFQIDASSVASPYIHETSKKVAQVFDQAMQNAPSVLVIDEMEAFLAEREMSSGHHRIEEVAEFLQRIPKAIKKEVLIIAMTNHIDMIDPAILRRGRFDHIIDVDYASKEEVHALLNKLLSSLPTQPDVDTAHLADKLAGRPLSDVAFVVREGARLTARAGHNTLSQSSLTTALLASLSRNGEVEGKKRRIGFV